MIFLIAAAALSCVATPCVIENVRVEVGDGTVLEDVSVVLSKGRIESVGSNVKVPDGARRIDGKGRVLTPGLIEVSSRLGLTEVLMVSETNDHGLEGQAITPALRVAEGFNPFSIWIPITREEGITSAITRPTGSVVKGLGYWIDLTGTLESAPDPEQPVGLFGSVGASAAMTVGGARSAVWSKLRALFEDARFLRKNRKAYDQGRSRKLVASAPDLEALYPVLDRKIPFVIGADRVSDLLAALEFARKQKVRLVLTGGAEAWRVAKELAAAKVPVVLHPSQQMPWSFDALFARDDAAAILDRAGVPLIISAGGWFMNVRRLRQEAGIAVGWGLPRDRALRTITLGPAEAFGMAGELGTVSRGKRANLVLWSGDPLELETAAVLVLIDGVEQSLDTRQKQLARRYLEAR